MQNSTDSVYGPKHWHLIPEDSDGIQVTGSYAPMLETEAEADKWEFHHMGHYRHVRKVSCEYLACTKYGRFDRIERYISEV